MRTVKCMLMCYNGTLSWCNKTLCGNANTKLYITDFGIDRVFLQLAEDSNCCKHKQVLINRFFFTPRGGGVVVGSWVG